MSTRQALLDSVAPRQPLSMAYIARREALSDLHRQLGERLTYARGCLEADDWAAAATQFHYAALLLEAIAGTEAGNAPA